MYVSDHHVESYDQYLIKFYLGVSIKFIFNTIG